MVNFIPKPAISVKERREEKGAGGPRAAQLIQLLQGEGGGGGVRWGVWEKGGWRHPDIVFL